MSRAEHATVVALVTHARAVPAAERERFATRLRGPRTGGNALVVETCHRVEAYVIAPIDRPEPEPDLAASLPDGGRLLAGEAAVRHAIAVAVGRDSVVIGEEQILHQLRESLASARSDGGLDTAIERLFALALGAGRRARSWRQGPPRSLADLALDAIERQSGQLSRRNVLVVGAGKMGGLAARAAAAGGATVSVANRSTERANVVAAQSGARTEALDPGPPIGRFAGVVVALGGPWAIGAATVEALVGGSTVVVDLSVPAAVDPAVAAALGPRFVSADALALADAEHTSPEDPSIARLDALIDLTTAEYFAWLEARHGRAAAQALTERADRACETELAELWHRLPRLDPDAREVIERMSRRLAARLLREPLTRLGRDRDGRHEQAARELFGL